MEETVTLYRVTGGQAIGVVNQQEMGHNGVYKATAQHAKGKNTLMFITEHITIFGVLKVTTEGEK